MSDDSKQTTVMQKADGLLMIYFGCIVSVWFELFSSSARAAAVWREDAPVAPPGQVKSEARKAKSGRRFNPLPDNAIHLADLAGFA